ncbi:uromodulin-like 1 [Onychostoma macrolepis]|uniref:uromodulin-like 1 n=1 Tax=Onychostoma macrolepis TaxID=369639 RepID=UPI00272BA236|nr:uromodulin-like 1 [Onychostoma macrolepis]
MHWVVGTWLITSLLGLGMGHNTLFEGYDRTLSGYHLCNMTESVSVTHVISYPTSYTQKKPCGGWLPWTMCDVTVYKTEYRTQVSDMTKQVMKCCHGYEQVGSYCALSLNRSAEFTSKPGLCPPTRATGCLSNNSNSSGSVCNWDIDCPQWQKCCLIENTSLISQCSDPVPSVNRTWCFNVTVTVKKTYELITWDKGLFNHTRLLHSVITGALGIDQISVHHVWTKTAGPFTTSSSLLVCSSKVILLEDISTKLYLLGIIEEVTNLVVQGMTNLISPPPTTTTTTPSWTTHSLPQPTTTTPSSTCDYTPEIISILSYNVTASSFHVAWTTNIQTGVTFYLVLLNGSNEIQKWQVMSYNWTFTDLSPVVLHTVRVTPVACGNQGNPIEIKVRTDGQSLGATARLKGVNYTEALKNPNSDEYKAFCDSVMNETLLSLSSEIRALVISGQVIIQITSLSSGSIIVNFSIIFQPGSNLSMSIVSSALMGSLQNSSVYEVDSNSIYIADPDECFLDKADCSPWAYCNNTFGSYICDCWSGYTDLNPSRPGRSCAVFLFMATTPTTNYPGVSSDSTGTTTSSTTMSGNPTMSSTVSTTHVQHNTTTSSASTATNGPTTATTKIPTTTLAPTTQNSVRTTTPDSQISSTPPDLIFHVAVECIPWYVTVVIRRGVLHNHYIQESSLYLGKAECGLSGGNASHVWLTTSWENCGTTLVHNDTHHLANVTLYNSVSTVSSVRLKVPVTCSYPRGILISTGYGPSGYFDDLVAGSGMFQVIVRLLKGTIPLPENYTLFTDDEIIVEVGVNTTVSQIKVVIDKCWVTSSSDSSETPYNLFLDKGCEVTNLYTTVLQNGNDTVALLSVQLFKAVDFDVIYLHCQVQICVEIQNGTCRPVMSVQTDTSDTSNTVQSVGFILLGVGVFLFSLAAIAGLVYHKRKIGNYNFRCKPQQQNFTYHVFDT